MLTQIINAKILTPQGWLKDGSVIIRDNKILEVTNCDLAVVGAELFDARGMYVVPGGVEIHVHGGGGRDFMEGTEDAFRKALGNKPVVFEADIGHVHPTFTLINGCYATLSCKDGKGWLSMELK